MTDDIRRENLLLVPRPEFQLRTLPMRFRWEATRRHPYYQDYWNFEPPQTSPAESLTAEPVEALRQFAQVALGMIGVNSLRIDPATEFDDLDPDSLTRTGWSSGAVQPVSIRGLVGHLIATLPRDALSEVTMAFYHSATEQQLQDTPPRVRALQQLSAAKSEALDRLIDEPLVSINPQATQTQVIEAIATLLKEWQEEAEITEKRSRDKEYPGYFDVWDCREGWCTGRYDPTQEKIFAEVGRELAISPSTAKKRYDRAFEIITGHPYSPELWGKLFYPLKLMLIAPELFVDTRTAVRPRKSPTRRAVPESALGASVEQIAGYSAIWTPDNSYSPQDLRLDVESLQQQGIPPEEIANRLEVSEERRPQFFALCDYLATPRE